MVQRFALTDPLHQEGGPYGPTGAGHPTVQLFLNPGPL
jgi:hypothetical protein